MFSHFLNVFFSSILSDGDNDDPCNWYFITVFLDTTAGIFLCYIILLYLEKILTRKGYYVIIFL